MKTKKFFDQIWVFWMSLVLLPPLAFLLIMCKDYGFTKRQSNILKIGTGIWLALWIGVARSGDFTNSVPPSSANEIKKQTVATQTKSTDIKTVVKTSHIYDNAHVKKMLTGDKSKVVGECSVCYTNSSDFTDEVLTDWYFNYVSKHNYNCNFIVYKDNSGKGCEAMNGIVTKDIYINKSDIGYSTLDSRKQTMYWTIDGTLENHGWLSELKDENPEIFKTDFISAFADVTDYNVDLENNTIDISLKMTDNSVSDVYARRVLDIIRNGLTSLEIYKDCNVNIEISKNDVTAVKTTFTTDSFDKVDQWLKIDIKNIPKYASEWYCDDTIQNYIDN